jgi:hypothetical protein
MARSKEDYNTGGCAKFWQPMSIRDGHSQPGNPHALSEEKAKEILTHGSVHGHPLTPKQKGYFGAVAGGNAKK